MDPRELGDPDDEELRIRRGRDFLAEGFVEVASFGGGHPFPGMGLEGWVWSADACADTPTEDREMLAAKTESNSCSDSEDISSPD